MPNRCHICNRFLPSKLPSNRMKYCSHCAGNVTKLTTTLNNHINQIKNNEYRRLTQSQKEQEALHFALDYLHSL